VARVKVGELADLPARKPVLVSVNGLDAVVYRAGDEVLAIGNECPHQGGSLCDGWVEGDIAVCPLHGWEFDLRTGACMTVPGERVPRYAVTVEAGAVYLEEAP
jgi:nitrite reductase/ring-hydroxylating ferredoxin subunit